MFCDCFCVRAVLVLFLLLCLFYLNQTPLRLEKENLGFFLFFFFSATNYSGLSLATIEPLNGSNFKKWKSDIEIYLGLTRIDFCLTEAAPVVTDDSSDQEKAVATEWTRANRMCLLIMKRLMTDIVRGSIADNATAADFLASIAEKFTENAKAETGVLLDSLTSMRYTGSTGMREHIMKIIDTASKLKDLNMPLDDQFVIHQTLNSLPSQYSQLKTTYNAQKDK